MNDLLRLGRFRERYRDDTGRWAPATWHIVSQFVAADPTDRPPVLASNEPELETFADEPGLAIDTADLFQVIVR